MSEREREKEREKRARERERDLIFSETIAHEREIPVDQIHAIVAMLGV